MQQRSIRRCTAPPLLPKSLRPPRVSNTNARARKSAQGPSSTESCDLPGPGFRAASSRVGQCIRRVGICPPGTTPLAAAAATRTAGAACMSAGRARAGKGRRRGARPGRLASRASSAVSTPHLQRAPGSGDCCAPAGHARPPHRAGAEVRRLAACMPASHVAAPQLMYGVWFHSPHRHVMPASAFRSLIVLSGAPEDGAMDLQRLGEVGAAPGQPVQAVSRAVAAAAGRAAAVRWRPPAAPPRLRADRACCVCAPAATSSCPTLAHGSSSCALCKQAGAVLPPASAAHLASCTGGCQLRLAASVRPFMQSPLRRQVRRVQAGGRRSAPARGPGRGLFPDPAVCPRAGRGPVRAAPGPAGPQLRWVQLGRQHPERGVPAQRSAPSYIGKPPDESAVEHGK